MSMRWSTAVLAAAMTAGCALFGGRVDLTTSPSMPAAGGDARFSVSKNENTVIVLRVKHLAQPDRLTPPAASYVVWVKASKDAAPQNIGALKVDSDLAGSLFTETPLHDFELFVTAEPAGDIQQPVGMPLLWTSHIR